MTHGRACRCRGLLRAAAALLVVLSEAAAASPDYADLREETARLLNDVDPLPTVHLYIGSGLEQAWLREVRLRIDEGRALIYRFSEVEARALQDGGLHPLPLPALSGAHRLRVEAVAYEAGATPHARRYAVQLDQSVAFGADQVLVLRMRGGSLLNAPALQLQPTLRATADSAAADYWQATGHELAAARLRAAGAGTLAGTPSGLSPAWISAVQRYNSAVAQLVEAPPQARAQLQALVEDLGADAASMALKDRAQLTIAESLLQASGDKRAAREAFRRVRSPGPYANAALLGLGWSYLLPEAAEHSVPALRARDPEALQALQARTPFVTRDHLASGARVRDLEQALVPWTELIGRDVLDPAVQEGMLALAYALEHAGAREQARRRYAQAIERLEAARAQIVQARRDVDDDGVFARIDARDGEVDNGWARLLVERRDDREPVALRALSAAPPVATALEDYRALRALDRALESAGGRVEAAALDRIAALRSRVQAPLAAARRDLRAGLRDELQRLDTQAARALSEAHFALARSYDLAFAEDL